HRGGAGDDASNGVAALAENFRATRDQKFLTEQEATERTRHTEHYSRPDSTKGGRESAHRDRLLPGGSCLTGVSNPGEFPGFCLRAYSVFFDRRRVRSR